LTIWPDGARLPTFAAVLIPSLIVFGQLSNRLGRRVVVAGSLGVAAFALILFALAAGTTWLFVAWLAQGLAVGGASAPAAAALVELERGEEAKAALRSVVGQAGGAAAGPLVAGALAEWAPWPLVLCYAIGAAATVVMGILVLQIPQTPSGRGRWRPQWPSVPQHIRGRFRLASLTSACVWAVGALFLFLGPNGGGKTTTLRLLSGSCTRTAAARSLGRPCSRSQDTRD
jgi:MFS family permease